MLNRYTRLNRREPDVSRRERTAGGTAACSGGVTPREMLQTVVGRGAVSPTSLNVFRFHQRSDVATGRLRRLTACDPTNLRR